MKKILLSLMLVVAFAVVKAQNVTLNEVYGNPGGANSEFIEIYNSAGSGSLDCYTIMVYYQNEGGSAQGWYVLDLPNTPAINSAPGYYVLASASTFSVQGTAGAMADVNWNDINFRNGSTNGYLKKFGWNGSGYTDLNLPNSTVITNLLDGTLNGSQFYFTLLFRNGVLINGFYGGANNGTLSNFAVSLGSLTVPLAGCGAPGNQFTVNFNTLKAVEFFNPSGGSDNGYARTSDGKCGAWVKTAPQTNHTPGVTNGSASGLAGSLTTTQLVRCGEFAGDVNPRVVFNITGFTGDVTIADDFPVDVILYYDVNGNQQIDGGDVQDADVKSVTGAEIGSADSIYLDAGFYLYPFILVYQTQRGCFDKVVALDNPCSALPVTLKSFTASRNRSHVTLKWETATEINNSDFELQRKIGYGNWVTVATIPTKAVNGFSNSPLSYEYADFNNTNGVSQYRLKQNDVDGKYSYSQIRTVRGEGQKGKTIIYPNPSSDGKVNIVFEDINGIRDVSLMDMSGRVIKQWKGVTNNNITVDNLNVGFYTVRIVNTETGEQVVEKIVVNKR